MSKDKQWKLLDLLNTSANYLKDKNIDSHRLNAEHLLAHVLKLKRMDLYLLFERPISRDELDQYRGLIRRRAKKEPLQYIIGETEFMGFPFKVSEAVLIPRPETEMLIEAILKLKDSLPGKINLLDVGTGSGCIAISLAALWENLTVCASDISDSALDIAVKMRPIITWKK